MRSFLAKTKFKLGAYRPQHVQPLQLLPGSAYARVALPLDYPPSRVLAPRYGYTAPLVPQLDEWFREHAQEYVEFLRFMDSLDPSTILLRHDPRQPLKAAWIGGAICAFDAFALFAMIQQRAPSRYVEIGSGMTTLFAREAITQGQLSTAITSIDPDPRQEVDAACDSVIRSSLEECDLQIFSDLKAGDIIFFDGSHRSFMNSDVTVFFIDVLPRLKPGVLVHIHDIHLPWDYPDMFTHWYWNEQYLLAVYMMGHMDSLHPTLPTAWICRNSLMLGGIPNFVDLGSSTENLSWLGGGSMWFTKV